MKCTNCSRPGPVPTSEIGTPTSRSRNARYASAGQIAVALTRLRARMKEARVRPDLVRSTGAGFVQLVRYVGDVFEDRR